MARKYHNRSPADDASCKRFITMMVTPLTLPSRSSNPSDPVELPEQDLAQESAPESASASAQPATAKFEAGEALPRILTALKYRDFRQVWIGNFLSNVGTWMQNVAQGWLVLQLTNSAFWVGVVSFAAAAPLLVFTILGGVIADHVDKRRLLVRTQFAMMASALVLAALT